MGLCLAGFVGDDTVRVVFLSVFVWPELLGILVGVDKILLVLMQFTLFPLFVGTVSLLWSRPSLCYDRCRGWSRQCSQLVRLDS